MKPLSIAALAFLAGLAPGLLLYWKASSSYNQTGPPQQQSSVATATPAPSPTLPAPPATANNAADPLAKSSGQKPKAPSAANGEPGALSALELQLRDRSEKLAAAERNLAETQARLSDLEAKVAALAEQSAQAQAKEKALAQDLESSAQRVTALQSDLKSRDAKLVELEAAQIKQARQATEAAQKIATRTSDLVSELEDLSRRRENYLSQILSRYREATDLFRALSLRLDNPRDGGTPLNNDLSRIQQAIQHADEDMRQLRALNQGSARVMKELAASRGKK